MKRVLIVLGAVVAVLLGAFALIWFVPAVQDRIVQIAMPATATMPSGPGDEIAAFVAGVRPKVAAKPAFLPLV